jgi:hypothetical protein
MHDMKIKKSNQKGALLSLTLALLSLLAGLAAGSGSHASQRPGHPEASYSGGCYTL